MEWRLEVQSSDGERCTVRPGVNLHRRDRVAKAAFNDIADRLCIDRKDIHDVLANWSPDQLVQHLESKTGEELREPAMRRFRR